MGGIRNGSTTHRWLDPGSLAITCAVGRQTRAVRLSTNNASRESTLRTMDPEEKWCSE